LGRREWEIEDQIVAHLAELGYPKIDWIRRAKLGRGGAGTVDLLVLPEHHKHSLVLIEVKQGNSGEAAAKVVGQLLSYYVAALAIGASGLVQLRRFARTYPRAQEAKPKSLQMMMGFPHRGPDLELLHAGMKIAPEQVALIIGLEQEPRPSLRAVCLWLKEHAKLDIRILLAHADGGVKALDLASEQHTTA